MSQSFTRSPTVDTDGTLAANSDVLVSSQKAVKTYVDGLNTAAALLAKILTVDGAGSGLDADTLDGISSAGFLQTSTYQALAPTWTGSHVFSKSYGSSNTQPIQLTGNIPGILLSEGAAAADAKKWVNYVTGSHDIFSVLNDAENVERKWLEVVRSATAVSSLSFGNATDNPTYSFLGTGAATFGGTVTGTSFNTFTGFANPSASLGLTAINGSAATAMRSDGAPALSQAITPTWTGIHAFTLNGKNAFTFDGTTSVIYLSFGNATDNPAYTFLGTGTTAFNGKVTIASAATYALEVSGSANGYIKINRPSKTSGEVALLLAGGTSGKDWYIYQPNSSDTLSIYQTRDLVTLNPASFNFGNATDNPTYTFLGTGAGTVSGAWTFGAQVTIGGFATSSALGIFNSTTAGKSAFSFQSNGTPMGAIGLSGYIEGDNSLDTALFAETGQGIRFYVNGSAVEVVTVNSSGNVIATGSLGVGISPGAKLHVYSGTSGEALRLETSDNPGDIFLSLYDGSGRKGYFGYGGANSDFLIVNEQSGKVSLFTNSTEYLRVDNTGKTSFFGVARLNGYTVAGLPSGTIGDTAYVTNALTPVFGSPVAGSGAVMVPVYYDGSNWIVG